MQTLGTVKTDRWERSRLECMDGLYLLTGSLIMRTALTCAVGVV